jgi:hypothetical protein
MGEDGRIAAGHGPKVLVDDRITVYSLAGEAFAWGICAAAAVLCVGLVGRGRREKKGE